MRTRYACALNGQYLHAIAPEIIVTDIAYGTPVRQNTTTQLAGRNGQRLFDSKTSSLSVNVSFEIHTQNVQRRRMICEDVQRWAMAGGYLTTNDRPEQRLRVMCETPPVIASALKWTQRLSIGFTAFERPFWEDLYPKVVTVTGNGSKALYAPGYAAPAIVEGRVTNSGQSAITTVDLTAGDTAFHLTGLALQPGKALTFGYDEQDVLFIRQDGQSALARRTAASSDDLTLDPCGMRTLALSADGAATARFEVRGRYL